MRNFCDDALVKTVIRLFKTELIRARRTQRSFETVELATRERVDRLNNRRLLAPIGLVPPAEAEAAYYERIDMQPRAAQPKPKSLQDI